MPLSDTQPEIILVDIDGNFLIVSQSQVISGTIQPFYIAAGVTTAGSASLLQLDSAGSLRVKAE